jgi:hypothetical protein
MITVVLHDVAAHEHGIVHREGKLISFSVHMVGGVVPNWGKFEADLETVTQHYCAKSKTGKVRHKKGAAGHRFFLILKNAERNSDTV